MAENDAKDISSSEKLLVSMSDDGSISTASSELLLQTLLNAIRTTNDIINECNNNQQNATSNGSMRTASKSHSASDAGVHFEKAPDEPLSSPSSPGDSSSSGQQLRWKLESQPATGEDFSSHFLLPPPVDFGGFIDDTMLLRYDEMVLPPPPPVFSGTEEANTTETMEIVLKETASDGDVSMSSDCTNKFPTAPQKVQEELSGKIVGGLFSVRQVCALFENDQMQIVREAVDMEPVSNLRLREAVDMEPVSNLRHESHDYHSDSSSPLSPGILVDTKAHEMQPPVGVTLKTFKCLEIRNNAKDAVAKNSHKSVLDSEAKFAELSSCVPDDIRKNGLRNALNTEKSWQNASEFDPKVPESNDGVLDCLVLSPGQDKKSPDPDKKSPDLNKNAVFSNGTAVSGIDPKVAVTLLSAAAAAAAAVGTIPAATEKDAGPGGIGEESREWPTAPPGTVDFNSDRNFIPVDWRQEAETHKSKESPDYILSSRNHLEKNLSSGEKRKPDSKESLTSTLTIEKNGETAWKRILPSFEKRKMEVLHVNVSKSVEQKENERHFVSKTVTKTMTQETMTTAAAIVTEFDRKPKVSSMLATDSTTTLENLGGNNFLKDLGDGIVDVQEETENDNKSFGLKETNKEIEAAKGETRKTKKKKGSVFDSLLDEKEVDSERKCFYTFGHQDAKEIQLEKISSNTEVKSVSSLEKLDKSRGPENVSKTFSMIPISHFTERKEEILALSQPTSLMVLPVKEPQNSAKNSATTDLIPSNPNKINVRAPLATPEESLEETLPYAHRSRQSSVGPSRSRQSSVSRCRSRQSSVGSLLGFQLPPLSGISTHFVVVAIDFGTTYSGYAFSFIRDPESIHMMRRWEGGDPGIINQKTPTTLLLTPDGKFHSFGFTARDFYHDLDVQEAKKWFYFEKFKMTLHHNAELNKETTLKAANGKSYSALTVFSHALTFFKDHALQELSDQSSTTIVNEDIRWVITVPAIWKAPAKQFMRHAAYQAGIASPDNPNQLLIALEPEAASIYVRKLRLYQLMPDPMINQLLRREPTPDSLNRRHVTDDDDDYDENADEYASSSSVKYKSLPSSPNYRHSVCPTSSTASVGEEVDIEGTNYMVVDCGGGTVDITVYEMESGCGQLKELHKATGGPYGSLGIDFEFEKLLIGIFGSEFIEAFRTKRPAGWVDLMIAFESRKRTASPFKNNPLNVSLPFSFIDYYKKCKGTQVENAIRKYGNKEVTWSSQGMLRLTTSAMRKLFQPTLNHIKQAVGDVLNNPNARDIKYMFLVGGFAESAILQMEMRKEFDHILKILIPQDVGLTILKGAVCFGLDPTVVSVRRCRMTFGVGVLNRFIPDKHPRSKMITKEGAQWCTDVFDKFVEVDQSVAIGETVVRSYTPAKAGQKSTIIHVYCTEKQNPQYITDPGVKRCGTLCLDLTDLQYRHSQKPRRREIQARMTFGDTEIKVTALDVATGKYVRAAIDFMNK